MNLTKTPCYHPRFWLITCPRWSVFQFLAHFPVTTFPLFDNSPIFMRLKAFEFHRPLNSAFSESFQTSWYCERSTSATTLIGGYSILLKCGNSLQSASSAAAKAVSEITAQKPFPESSSGLNHILGAKSISLAAKSVVSLTAPSSSRLYRPSNSARQSCMTDTDSHSVSSSVASASSTSQIQIKLPLLSASASLSDDGGFPKPS